MTSINIKTTTSSAVISNLTVVIWSVVLIIQKNGGLTRIKIQITTGRT